MESSGREVFSQLQVDGQLSVEPSFRLGKVERQAEIGLQRVARDKIKERIDAALKVRARLGGIERHRRRVGDGKGDIARRDSAPRADFDEASGRIQR